MKKYFFSLLLILFFGSGYSQTEKLDSLWKVYNDKNLSDTTRLQTLGYIAWSYAQNNPDTAILLAEQQLQLGKHKYLKYDCTAYNSIGAAYMNKGNYPKALEYYFTTLRLDEELNNKKGIAACYANIGTVYELQSDFPKALEYDLKSLHIREEIGDKLGIGNCYGNIGNVYYNQFNLPKALEYYKKDLQIREEIGDIQSKVVCYNNIGNVYGDQLNFEKALENYLKALKIGEELGDINGIGNSYGNIGLVYSSQSNYPKALEYEFMSLRTRAINDDQLGKGTSYLSIAELYNKQANYKLAILYADSAQKITKEIGDITSERLAYQVLADVYYKTGKYKEAYINYVNFKQLTDSVFNEENSKQLGDMKTNFEVERKEAELKLKSEAEKKIQYIITGSVIFGLVLVLIFSVIIFRRLQFTRKQKQIIEEQKILVEIKGKETEAQKHIIEEKHKEITDSINYAERIQRALLASKKMLDEHLPQYFILFKPKDIVSGDFYWASKIIGSGTVENFVLVTADSTGHGVPGAIMSIVNIASLKEAVIQGITRPDLILNETRRLIIENLKNDGSAEGGKDGMDASLLSFDFKNNILHCACAYNPVWIIRDGELIEIKPDRMPIGKHDKYKTPFTLHSFNLQKGDMIYTLTDGFPDQFGGTDGKKFKSKQLQEMLLSIVKEPMDVQKQKLDETFTTWRGNLEQVDDVTIIGIRI